MNRLFGLVLCAASAYPQTPSGTKPALTETQIQAAIEKGSQYLGGDNFFRKGLKGRKLWTTRYTDITFFDDWQKVAMDAANARFQMRELKPDQVRTTGLLHAYVDTRVTLFFSWTDLAATDAFLRRANLVLIIHGTGVQPVERRVVKTGRGSVQIGFDFDVSVADLVEPVTVVSIDGDDGHRHQRKGVDLSGILGSDRD